jgi:hypothetical protein
MIVVDKVLTADYIDRDVEETEAQGFATRHRESTKPALGIPVDQLLTSPPITG